jgi:hypothetical protein
MHYRFFAPVVAAFAVSSVAVSMPAIARADDSPVTMKYIAKVGDVEHQQVLMKAMVQGIDAVVKNTQKRTVKDVKDTGETTYLVTDEGGTMTLMGNDQVQPAGPDVTIKRDKTGKIIDWKPAMDINGALSPELMRTLAQLYTLILPTDAVKTNDKWKVELDNPLFKDKKIKIENTYLGLEKVDGVSLWKIKQTTSVPTDGEGGIATFEGTFWLKPETAQAIKIEGAAKEVPSQFGKLSFTVVVSPVKDDKPVAPVVAPPAAPK